jgi:lipopolysaccharide transport system permease protein
MIARPAVADSYLSPIQLLGNLWRHRDLMQQVTRRDVESRYKGSILGILWLFIQPLILLATYTFVFGVIFKARWPNMVGDDLGDLALIIFCSLIPFNLFSESISKAPGIILTVPNYVKKVVFPLEILPVSVLGAALFQAAINLGILLIAAIVVTGRIQPTLLLLPVVLLPLLCLTLGLSWFLASLGVFIRDVSQIIGLALQVLFFLTPIFYPVEVIPEPFDSIVLLNPLAAVVDNFRRVVLWGVRPQWTPLAVSTLTSGVVMLLGYAWFMRTKKAFADVI